MNKLSNYLRALLVFVVGFVLFSTALFFFWKSEDYSGVKEVSLRFPVAVIEAGAPNLIEWGSYVKQPEQFQNSLIANSSGGIFELNSGKSFILTPMEKGRLRLEVRSSGLRQYAEYTIAAGIVRPHRLRAIDQALLIWASGLALLLAVCLVLWQRRANVSS